MKRMFVVLLIALAAGLAAEAQTPPVGSNHGINAAWSQPVGTTQWPMVYCSSTVAASCVQGYTETLTPPAGVPGNVVIPFCTGTQTPATASCVGATDITGTAIAHAWKPGGALYCGPWGVSVVANWLDSNGNPIASPALTGSLVEPCPFVASPASGPLTVSLIP